MKVDSPNYFQAVRRTKASREIVAQVREMVAGGHLKAGDRLPPERELSQLFGVGRSTLREAIRVLESLGLVDVRAGEGTFLAEGDAANAPGKLPTELFSKWSTQLNLCELRTVLEPGLAALAARRATSDHLTKMRGVLAAQAAQVRRGESGTDEDATFHGLIAEATRNPALVHLMKHLAKSLWETRDPSLQRDGRPARSLRENRAILAAIEAKNPTLAARRMQAHIRSLERVLFTTELQLPELLPSAGAEVGNGSGFYTVRPAVSSTSVDREATWPHGPR
jgi:GntR family transcriptional repressor for pyruvate dehydrogenase complex